MVSSYRTHTFIINDKSLLPHVCTCTLLFVVNQHNAIFMSRNKNQVCFVVQNQEILHLSEKRCLFCEILRCWAAPKVDQSTPTQTPCTYPLCVWMMCFCWFRAQLNSCVHPRTEQSRHLTNDPVNNILTSRNSPSFTICYTTMVF